MGATSKQASHGFDKSDKIKGVSTPNNHEKIIFSRSPGIRGESSWLMATDGRYKLVANPVEPLWFFDLEKDPSELINLAVNGEYCPEISELAVALLNYAEEHDDPNLPLGKLRDSLLEAISIGVRKLLA